LAVADTFWVVELKREELLDLAQGKAGSVRSVSSSQLAELSAPKGMVTAIWRAPSSASCSPLPQVILGDTATLEDLFAWSASYLRGMGPITSQTRIITPDIFRLALEAQPKNAWREFAGAAVGTILNEVQMHAHRVIPFTGITLAACRSTLSFALMRAAILGINDNALSMVAELWAQARSLTGQTLPAVPIETISQVTVALAKARLGFKFDGRTESNQWFNTMLSDSRIPALLREIGTAFGPLPNELALEGFIEQTAEARVRLLDDLGPVLISHSTRSRAEKAFAIALIAYLCRPGLQQQATLLASFGNEIPESLLWLGALQGAVPFTDTLAEGDGLGWRVARDLFEPGDLFAPPTCDIALSELQIVGRGKAGARMIKALAKARIDVELFPGISIFVRATQAELSDQQSLALEPKASAYDSRNTDYDPHLISDEFLFDAENALSVLSRFLRHARARSMEGRPSDRKRRR
jgi:hypothetical protein